MVLALAGLAAALVPGKTPQTPSAVGIIEGFPEYANGAHVVGAASGELPERRIEVAIVPTTLDLEVFTRCDRAADNVDIDMVGQTPGLLHVRVNGVEIVTGEWWDYEQGGHGMYGDRGGAWKDEFGLDPRPDDQVTIDIVPEHVTGAWQVVLKTTR